MATAAEVKKENKKLSVKLKDSITDLQNLVERIEAGENPDYAEVLAVQKAVRDAEQKARVESERLEDIASAFDLIAEGVERLSDSYTPRQGSNKSRGRGRTRF